MNLDNTRKKELVPDISEARRFLTLLEEGYDQFVFETIEEPKPIQGAAKVIRYFGSIEEHEEVLIKANLAGSGVFVAVNATDGRGRKRENIKRVRALFVDLDGSPLDPVLRGPMQPHIVVESSPGRFHAYWIVENVALDQFENAQKLLAKQFGGDPCVCDLPRLMRLPGFLHRKGAPHRSCIIETSGAQPYSFEEFQRAFGYYREQAPKSTSSQSSHSNPITDTVTLMKLRERGLIKRLEAAEEGRWLIRCPWAAEHTNGEDAHYFSKASNAYPGEGFNCFHAHCKQRDIRALRFFLGLQPIEGVEPLPLFREVPPASLFPVEALGLILGNAAREIHRTIQAPLAVIAQSLLGAASLVTQGHFNVEIDGRSIALSLYLITIAESGERKSAVDDIALLAVLDWQCCLWNVYREERHTYEIELKEWQDSKKIRKSHSEGTANIEDLTEPESPIMPIIIVEEPTYEGLVKYLEHGQPSVGVFSDEGGRFLGGSAMNRDNLLKTMAGFSSLWDAKQNKPITRIRSGDKSLALYGRRVALHLMIQEAVYSELNQQSMCELQGFLPRCLITFPESMAGSRVYVTDNTRELPEVRQFREQCNKLLDSPFTTAPPPAPKNQLEPNRITLSSDARMRWVQFYNNIESRLGLGGIYHPIRRFGSKAAEHVLRIAGVLAAFENPSVNQIELDHVERAESIIEYYLTERLRLDSYCCIEPSLLSAQRVLDWALSKRKSGVLLRELYQYGPPDVRSKNRALAILKILEDHGWAFPIPAHELKEGAKGRAWRFILPNEG